MPTITTASALNNLTLISNVTQATPINLTGLNLTGSLTYNTNSAVSVTDTNCTITGTVSNLGTGTVSATLVNSTIGTFGANVVNVPPSYTFTLAGLQSGSEVYIYAAGTSTILASTLSSGTSFAYSHTAAQSVDVSVAKAGFDWYSAKSLSAPLLNTSYAVTQIADPFYSAT